MRQRLGEYEDHDAPSFGLVGEERGHEEQEEAERPRRLPTALLTVGAMVVFAGGLWFAYSQGARNATAPSAAGPDKVPLIRADERPTKVKPDQPGGMDVPDRDKLVFGGKPAGPGVERLLPPAEQPKPVPPAPPPQPAPPIGAMLNPVEPGPAPGTPAPQGTAPAAKAPTKPGAEQKVATAEAKPGALKPAPTAPATSGSSQATQPGTIRVQLGSVRTPEAAREEWARLKQTNSDMLGRLTAVAVRADLGDKGIYYRIQAGPLADAAAADHLCAELKKRNLGCTLVR